MTPRVLRAVVSIALAGLAFHGADAAEVLKLRPKAVFYADAKGTPLRAPQGVGCRNGAFVVADSGNGRVLRFEVSGALVQATGEIVLSQIAYPIRAAVDRAGDVFVLDGKTRRLARVAPDGTFRSWVEIPPAAEGAAVSIRSFAVDGEGRVFVVDVAGARVVVVGADGKPERMIPFPPEARFVSDVTVDPRGTIFAVDSVRRAVYAARKGESAFVVISRSLEQDLDFPAAIEADGAGHLFLADENGGGIVILGPDGSFRGRQSALGWKDGYLRYPSGLCTDGKGLLVVADRENQRVQVFSIGD